MSMDHLPDHVPGTHEPESKSSDETSSVLDERSKLPADPAGAPAEADEPTEESEWPQTGFGSFP